MRCDNCGDGLSFSFGEVNTFSLGRPYHKYCYEKNVKNIHDEYRKENKWEESQELNYET